MSPEPIFSDLEIGLHLRETDSYTLELRYTPPGSDTDERVVREGPQGVRLDFTDLLPKEDDNDAYGRQLTKLFARDRLGFVMEDFNNRYAELSTEVASRIEAVKFREIVPPNELARPWTADNDARNYVVLGDPAVKPAVGGEAGVASTHPELESITLSSALAVTDAALAAADSAPEPDADPRRQALCEAPTHLEQAVGLLKRALDAD